MLIPLFLRKIQFMTAGELMKELFDTYVALRPSPTHGIGVFAVRDIPQGCRDMFSKDNGEWIKVPKAEIEQLPEYTKEMIDTYFIYDDNYYYIEKHALKKMDLVCYLNHSEQPNIKVLGDGQFFEASRDIKQGEELFIDYAEVTN
jgi:SET domain-containing protein